NFLTENAGTEDAPGQSFDLDVDSPSQGQVNLEELVHTAQRATSEEEQHAALKKMMIIFNELLPRIPLWTYTYLSPAIEGVRVESFDPDHPASQNEQYQDNHIMLQLIQGDLKSVCSSSGPRTRYGPRTSARCFGPCRTACIVEGGFRPGFRWFRVGRNAVGGVDGVAAGVVLNTSVWPGGGVEGHKAWTTAAVRWFTKEGYSSGP